MFWLSSDGCPFARYYNTESHTFKSYCLSVGLQVSFYRLCLQPVPKLSALLPFFVELTYILYESNQEQKQRQKPVTEKLVIGLK